MLLVASVALGASACGRFGFDPSPVDVVDAPPGDAGPDADPAQYVLTTVQLADSGTYSWVDLDVDWTRGLAYVGTRESGQCFAVIDLAVTPPAVIQRRGPPATGGANCLGVRLETPRQLLVSSEAGAVIELWDLGPDARAGAYTRLASIATATPRRLAADSVTAGKRYVSSRSAVRAFQVLDTNPVLVLGDVYTAPACPNSYNAVTHLSTHLAVTGCSEDLSPVTMIEDATMAQASTLPADNGGLSGFWSAARTSSADLAVMGGWVSATIVADTTAGLGWRMLERWDNGSVYRTATIVEPAGMPPQLWAGTGDGALEVLELDTLGAPTVLHHASLGAPGEVYGLSVDLASGRAIAVTNRGTLVVVDINALPPTDVTWPAF